MVMTRRGKERLHDVDLEVDAVVEVALEQARAEQKQAHAQGRGHGKAGGKRTQRKVEKTHLDPDPPPPSADAVEEIVDVVDAADEIETEEQALQRRQRVFVREVAMSIALTPFPFAAYPFTGGWIGWVVWFNGVAAHMAHGLDLHTARWLGYHDTAWNVGLCIYVNIATHAQPTTAILTLTALVAWLGNGFVYGARWTVVHILFVQWALCFALFIYEYRIAI
jgi:hypothetical protein